MKTIRQEIFESHQRIDRAAEETTLKYVTGGVWQETRYQAKLQQARTYRAAHALDATATVPPYIANEATRTAASAIDAAVAIDTTGTWWLEVKNVEIDNARLNGKAAVSAAALASGSDADKRAAIAAAEDTAKEALEAL